MNCFVIMPFSREFDDVYAAIRAGVEGAVSNGSPQCFRLDEVRPAGRITDRLLEELQTASLCVADLSNTKPNVMWEVGYAMALRKPTVIVIQSLRELPFDLRDMQTVEYDRNHLHQTLSVPLRRAVVDTITRIPPTTLTRPDPHDSVIAELRTELSELKTIIAQAVNVWNPSRSPTSPSKADASLAALEGAWFNIESGHPTFALDAIQRGLRRRIADRTRQGRRPSLAAILTADLRNNDFERTPRSRSRLCAALKSTKTHALECSHDFFR